MSNHLRFYLGLLGAVLLTLSIGIAGGLFDDSVPTGPFIDEDLPAGLPSPIAGSFEGGLTGTKTDAGINNAVPEDQLRKGGFDMPTGGKPSPLFDAQPFTQPMLRFEEFGPEPMPLSYAPGAPYPAPLDAQSNPDGEELDNFLRQPLYPPASRWSNTIDQNPWAA